MFKKKYKRFVVVLQNEHVILLHAEDVEIIFESGTGIVTAYDIKGIKPRRVNPVYIRPSEIVSVVRL